MITIHEQALPGYSAALARLTGDGWILRASAIQPVMVNGPSGPVQVAMLMADLEHPEVVAAIPVAPVAPAVEIVEEPKVDAAPEPEPPAAIEEIPSPSDPAPVAE